MKTLTLAVGLAAFIAPSALARSTARTACPHKVCNVASALRALHTQAPAVKVSLSTCYAPGRGLDWAAENPNGFLCDTPTLHLTMVARNHGGVFSWSSSVLCKRGGTAATGCR